jgi:cyclopropane-fatty-acyl-phospholipid synthase
MSHSSETNSGWLKIIPGHFTSVAGRIGGLAREHVVLVLRRFAESHSGGAPFRLVLPDGSAIEFGRGDPVFTLRAHGPEGMTALASLDALTIADAYMDGKLEFEGDLLTMLRYQEFLRDTHPGIYWWRRLHPALVGRQRLNPAWIALHYDADNAQLHVSDADWHTYTPGLYESEDEELELGAHRKLAQAFDGLRLQPGQHLLEAGCGWGGMLRFSARRGVRVTGITLSQHQKEYVEQKIEQEKLPAGVVYQDFLYIPTSRTFRCHIYDGRD